MGRFGLARILFPDLAIACECGVIDRTHARSSGSTGRARVLILGRGVRSECERYHGLKNRTPGRCGRCAGAGSRADGRTKAAPRLARSAASSRG